MKFRVIQSNNRGLIARVGDRTYASRRPARGEEESDVPTLFIWSKKPMRLVARCWTRWTGEMLERDYIYEVTHFRDIVDLKGDSRYHQWCSKALREQMWEMAGPIAYVGQDVCPDPRAVHEPNRFKSAIYIERRKARLKAQTPELSEQEKARISGLYRLRDSLNEDAGCIAYHVDHIVPLVRGGLHHPCNLRVISSIENAKKGAGLESP